MAERIEWGSLVERARWQRIQDFLSDFLGVTIVTLSSDGEENLTRPSNPPYLCKEFLKESKMAVSRCLEFHREIFSQATTNWREGIICPFGFYLFFIPLEAGNRTFGYMRIGPLILGKGEHLEGVGYRVKEAGLSADLFFEFVRELRRFSFYNINSLLEFLHEIFTYILDSSLDNLLLEEVIMRIILGKNIRVDEVLFTLGRMVSSEMGAERCSFMLWNRKSRNLYIIHAKGIPDDVVRKTRIKPGEHIAGIVAQRRQPLLIDSSNTDSTIIPWMVKPEIKTALSYPVEINGKFVGVLNISSYTDNRRLASEGVFLIEKIVGFLEKYLPS